MNAYMSGLEDRLNQHKSVDQIHSVASFFVSRVDTKVDLYLEEKIPSLSKEDAEMAKKLLGKAAIANSKLAYELFENLTSAARFQKLKKAGANIQRLLWASTSAKNPKYRDVIYVEELIGAKTVNTVPPATLEAFIDHGVVKVTIKEGIEEANEVFANLSKVGIDIQKVTDELEFEGVNAFVEAFETLFESIEIRRKAGAAQLGVLQRPSARCIRALDHSQIIKRLVDQDVSLWTKDRHVQDEIRQRLGWLNAPQQALASIPELEAFAVECRRAGFKRGLVLGMGGSSLAPEVYSLVFSSPSTSGLQVKILDSTDPDQVKEAERFATAGKTLFIVSSKSGTTSEVNAFLDYFWAKTETKYKKLAGQYFIAISDPGTSLVNIAKERKFRRIFLADPTVGGRFSALTYFGLVPAALLGIDLSRLLGSTLAMQKVCLKQNNSLTNPGLILGAILGEAYKMGKDKLTILADRQLQSFGSWLEQLIAESSGKDGRGLIPIDNEPVVDIERYGDDRLFLYFRLTGEKDEFVEKLTNAHRPVMVFL